MRGESGPRLPGPSEWFDLWHTHIFPGSDDSLGPQARRDGLRSLFEAWGRVEVAACRLTRPWQSWLVIDPADPIQDAIYLHSPNPNRDNFPYPFEGVNWGAEIPRWLEEFVTGSDVEIGRSVSEEAELYWVRRAVGAA